MNLAQLINVTRMRLGDIGNSEVRVTDEFLTESLNRGVVEALERGFSLYEADDSAVIELTLSADVDVYTIHDSIEQILHVRRQSDGLVLLQTTEDELDFLRPYWTEDAPNKPEFYIRDGQRIQLYPVPDGVDVLELKVSRMPLTGMVDDADEPELPTRYHNDLTWYAIGEAAVLAGNTDLEARAMSQFERTFGRRRSIKFNAVSKATPNNAVMYCTRPML